MRMTQPAKSQEPSMEEILASIRRIIADDDANKSAQRAAEPPAKPVAAAAPRPAAPPARAVPEPAPSVAQVHDEELPASAPLAADVEEAADILDLTESMASPVFDQPAPDPSPAPAAAPQFRKIEGFSEVSFNDTGAKPASARAEAAGVRLEAGENGLLSNATSAAVDSAFNTLAQTVLVQNARTLEDLVREMLRPLLKAWLDDNLPGMVERLVRAEIERVARGR